MAIPHAKSGDVVTVGIPLPPDTSLEGLVSETLIRDEHIEVFRFVLEPGTRMQEHRASGSLTIQCLLGEIELSAHGATRMLKAGDLVHLRNAEAHAVATDQFTVLLLTLFLNRV
ncbi:cupin [Uliginosibacterium sp. sgz301328]|uniref:cupin n=1 Tax=Uliginosibacterium sp. sgz301328 TaxID=3243764 RepID=UPI00359EAAEA